MLDLASFLIGFLVGGGVGAIAMFLMILIRIIR